MHSLKISLLVHLFCRKEIEWPNTAKHVVVSSHQRHFVCWRPSSPSWMSFRSPDSFTSSWTDQPHQNTQGGLHLSSGVFSANGCLVRTLQAIFARPTPPKGSVPFDGCPPEQVTPEGLLQCTYFYKCRKRKFWWNWTARPSSQCSRHDTTHCSCHSLCKHETWLWHPNVLSTIIRNS